MNWTRFVGISLLLIGAACLVVVETAEAQPAQTVLYEVTENMHLAPQGGIAHRLATAALQGWAHLGTPLCPLEALVTNPRAETCTITAIGSDDVSTITGLGTVSGSYAVVVQGDNATDAPEYVVQTGTFTGTMDLSAAVLGIAPLGYLKDGYFTIDGYPGYTIPFTGTFRLPFTVTAQGEHRKPARQQPAFYLGDDFKKFRVRDDERSLGWPAVRLEVNFGF